MVLDFYVADIYGDICRICRFGEVMWDKKVWIWLAIKVASKHVTQHRLCWNTLVTQASLNWSCLGLSFPLQPLHWEFWITLSVLAYWTGRGIERIKFSRAGMLPPRTTVQKYHKHSGWHNKNLFFLRPGNQKPEPSCEQSQISPAGYGRRFFSFLFLVSGDH